MNLYTHTAVEADTSACTYSCSCFACGQGTMKDSASSYILNTIPRKIRVKVSQIIPYPHAHLPNAASFTVTPVHLHQGAVGVEVRDRAIVLEPGPDLGRLSERRWNVFEEAFALE